jgi:hypothetical protein
LLIGRYGVCHGSPRFVGIAACSGYVAAHKRHYRGNHVSEVIVIFPPQGLGAKDAAG